LSKEPVRRESMNRKDTPAGLSVELNALLGKGSQFEGKLVFEGTVRIDGKFKGEIHSQGKLVVGENGEIEGELWVDSAVISGKVNGNLNAKSRIELQPQAKILGNINTPLLIVQEGAIFEGNCQMSKATEQKGIKPKSAEPSAV